eukprot:366073-Pelagomonas_calceolata.AAC.1
MRLKFAWTEFPSSAESILGLAGWLDQASEDSTGISTRSTAVDRPKHKVDYAPGGSAHENALSIGLCHFKQAQNKQLLGGLFTSNRMPVMDFFAVSGNKNSILNIQGFVHEADTISCTGPDAFQWLCNQVARTLIKLQRDEMDALLILGNLTPDAHLINLVNLVDG